VLFSLQAGSPSVSREYLGGGASICKPVREASRREEWGEEKGAHFSSQFGFFVQLRN